MPFFSGANPWLTPETSETKTLGFVYSPDFVEGLNLTFDGWKIQVEDPLVTDSPNTILNDCYINLIESRCALFTRDPTLDYVNDMAFGLRNAGHVITEGYDFDLAYRFDTDSGRFNIALNNTCVSRLSSNSTNNPIRWRRNRTVPMAATSGYVRTCRSTGGWAISA